MQTATLIASTIVTVLLGTLPASVGTRGTLVIGSSDCKNATLLLSPVNDAALISSLRRLGFNAKHRPMPAMGFAVIFFAVRGFQIGGENWHIPPSKHG